jgi:hypothetical protein
MDRVKQFNCIQNECLEIFKKKNADYGDAFATHGVVGVLVRINDKLSRFTNITKKGIEINVTDETLKDTLMDLHNYAAMAIMCLEQE